MCGASLDLRNVLTKYPLHLDNHQGDVPMTLEYQPTTMNKGWMWVSVLEVIANILQKRYVLARWCTMNSDSRGVHVDCAEAYNSKELRNNTRQLVVIKRYITPGYEGQDLTSRNTGPIPHRGAEATQPSHSSSFHMDHREHVIFLSSSLCTYPISRTMKRDGR